MEEDTRPKECRFRLQDEGKSYPRSSCFACNKGILTGLGKSCSLQKDKEQETKNEIDQLNNLIKSLQKELDFADMEIKILKNRTAKSIQFTYEPTKERVKIYSGDDNSFEILSKYPEFLNPSKIFDGFSDNFPEDFD
jgi:hypothetical protein